MRRLFRITLALIAILIIGALVAPIFISSESFKQPLIAQIEGMTGRTLSIDGNLKLRLFPFAGVYAENITLSGMPGVNGAPPLIKLSSMEVEVATWPLLHHNIVVQRLFLNEPRITLEVDGNGRKNWQFSPKQKAASGEAALPSKASSPKGGLQLSGVKITEGTVIYRNAQTKEKFEVTRLNLTSSLSGLSGSFNANGSCDWNGKTLKFSTDAANAQALYGDGASKLKAQILSDLLSFNVEGALEKRSFSGKATASSPSLKQLMGWVSGKPSTLPATLALDMTGETVCSETFCSLSKATIKLDSLEVKGNIKAVFGGAVPSIEADVATDMLDFNPFMPEAQRPGTSLLVSSAYAQAARWSAAPIDFSGLRSVNLNATVQTKGIKIKKLVFGATTIKAGLKAGTLNATMSETDFYGGKIALSAHVGAAVKGATVTKDVTFKDVQLEPFLKDMEFSDRFVGALDGTIHATTQGASEQEFVNSMGGNGQMKINNGVLRGIDLGNMVRNVQTSFSLRDKNEVKTEFSEAGASFTIAQGIISNKDLVMVSAGMRLNGEGQIHLPAWTVNYRLTPQMVQAAKTPEEKAKEGVAVPVLVQGSMDNPAFKADLGSVIKQAIEDPEKLKQQLKNSREMLKEGVPKGTGKKLKNLLKGF